MEKNTIWAIVLSVLVVILSFIFIPNFLGLKNTQTQETIVQTEEQTNTENSQNTVNNQTIIENQTENEQTEEELALEQTRVEEKIIVNTKKAQIVLTNKGADIINYTLDPETHKDYKTGKGIELSDNISDINRTCSLSFGEASNSIVNDLFDVKKIDDYTYLFTRNIIYGGKKFTLGKKYTFTDDEYMFKLDILIHEDSAQGLNYNGVAYTLRTSPQIGPYFNKKQNKYENRQFVAFNGKKAKKQILTDGVFKYYEKDIIWGGIAGKYFIELVIPTDSSILNKVAYSTKIEKDDYANAQAMFERKSFAASDVQDTYYLYFGPRNEKDIQIYNVKEKNKWNLNGLRLTESLQSSGWLSWLETILKFCLEKLHIVFKNWGVCIILLTIILKLLLFPLSKKQSLGSLKMQALQPQVQAIQKKYAGDQQKMQAEMSKLYKEANYNPASGCLPLIFQFLILFAMYNLFNNYFEFRGASFIKGWIPDLSTGDSVFSFEKNIPIISGLLGNQIRLLPVIYVATQLLSGKITQNSGMSNGTNQKQMKFMTYGLPLIFFFVFYNAPAGLLLYWLTSNVLQIGQQLVINKIMKDKRANPEVVKVIPKKNGKKRK